MKAPVWLVPNTSVAFLISEKDQRQKITQQYAITWTTWRYVIYTVYI
jgi:hypothetical protein